MSITVYPNNVTASRIAVEGGFLVTYLVKDCNMNDVFTLLTNKVGYIYKRGVSPLGDIRKRLVFFSFFLSQNDDPSADLAGMSYGCINYFINEGSKLKCNLFAPNGNKYAVSYSYNVIKGEWAGGINLKVSTALFTVFEPL